MLELVQCGELRDDGTAPYEVKLDKPYTVREFANEVLLCYARCGFIRTSASCCPYSMGKLWKNACQEDADRLVVSATADGGLVRMDYFLQTRVPF